MRKLQNRSKGFTIIELLIVLAIAALIILIVLIAVPQLQRNQRNTARQNIAGRIATELNNYTGNNNGIAPKENASGNSNSFAGADGFADRYFGDDIDINDPSSGESVLDADNVIFSSATNLDPENPGEIYYSEAEVCDGEDTKEGNTRNFALVIQLEGGARYCLDNS